MELGEEIPGVRFNEFRGLVSEVMRQGETILRACSLNSGDGIIASVGPNYKWIESSHLHQSDRSAVGHAEEEQGDECGSGCPDVAVIISIVFNPDAICGIYKDVTDTKIWLQKYNKNDEERTYQQLREENEQNLVLARGHLRHHPP
ncbi:hypothetical protein scyTo_0012416 [Scyliorhinus torazame]|uniref:Uncharacterized protein n=1 Tax=Scyliorhinus torazame TaxID=75743 RepID=A0A401P8G6_SCYTO|nr:hypothetical protein [Scyliorhinus torazame]